MKKYSTGIALMECSIPSIVSAGYISIYVESRNNKRMYFIHMGRRPRLIGRRNIEQKLKTCIVFKNRN